MNRRLREACLILAILFTPEISPVHAQLPDRSEFPNLSIGELFDLGGQETGDLYLHGMPWPAEELAKRDLTEVVAEAVARLSQPPQARYTHAFNVHLLIRLKVPELDEILLRHFPTLDDLGRYEVLLYALDTLDERFRPLFVEALEQVTPLDEISRVAILAAAFAELSPGPDLHASLQRYVESHTFDAQNLPGVLSLDGFPYGDVSIRGVTNLADLFAHAIAVGEFEIRTSGREMTSVETDELRFLRQQLLSPVERALTPGIRPLREVLAEMERELEGFRLDHVSRDLLGDEITVAVTPGPRSQAAHLASLCNQLNLLLLNSLTENNAWSISRNNENNLGITNGCRSQQGLLLSLYISQSNYRDLNSLTIRVIVKTSFAWLQDDRSTFELDSIVLHETDIDFEGQNLLPAVPGQSVLQIDSGDASELGRMTIRGRVLLTIPSTLRRIEWSLAGVSEFSVEEGGRILTYTADDNIVRYHWGVRVHCCGRITSTLPVDTGVVEFTDDTGRTPPVSEIGGIGNRSLRGKSIAHQRRDGETWRPDRLVWTYVPTLETIEIPVVFEDVEVIPQVLKIDQ